MAHPRSAFGASAWLRARGLAGMAALMLLACTQTSLAGEERTPLPMIERARAGTQCIADPATMRREHPAMLEHQRDATVRGGVRGAKASLKACIACHASAQTGSVAKAETNFCVSCHNYTAVRIDCFGCHASRPHAGAPHPILASDRHSVPVLRLPARHPSGPPSAPAIATVAAQRP